MGGDSTENRFLTAIGHDMRQPLHALLLYLSALERRIQDEETREILGKADRAAHSLASMIEALIQLARLNADEVETDIEPVSLQMLFNDLVSHTPTVKAEATSLSVNSDPALLNSILQHFISNATLHGGGAALLSAAEIGGDVEIIVRDSGPGIALEDQERIFAEFVRLEAAGVDGLGVGLTIARKLATVLGHSIEVRSVPGDGAAFVVRAQRA